ncbi:hypothetical protein M422DRAFT_41854 [Sphaerobolus stellatus SS14]|nr:hypothetical protein M422DRAFT_41854 [Sphaerobolus stellatus SS14]
MALGTSRESLRRWDVQRSSSSVNESAVHAQELGYAGRNKDSPHHPPHPANGYDSLTVDPVPSLLNSHLQARETSGNIQETPPHPANACNGRVETPPIRRPTGCDDRNYDNNDNDVCSHNSLLTYLLPAQGEWNKRFSPSGDTLDTLIDDEK